MENPKKFSKDYNDLERIIRNKKRVCSYPGCNHNTIRSHNISQAVLKKIARDGHIRMLHVNPYKGLAFQSVGIREATTFAGFCNLHDNDLFSLVDKEVTEFENSQSLLLLNYRATVHEKIKKINRRETYALAAETKREAGYAMRPYFNYKAEQYGFNFYSSQWYEKQLLESIQVKNNSFLFEKIHIPYCELIVSECFTFEPANISDLKRSLFARNLLFPFSDLYIHIYPDPEKKHSTLILSMHEKDKDILIYLKKYWSSLPQSKMVSDILVLYVEGWGCSEMFYETHIKYREDHIFSIIAQTANQSATEREMDLNLFESLQLNEKHLIRE